MERSPRFETSRGFPLGSVRYSSNSGKSPTGPGYDDIAKLMMRGGGRRHGRVYWIPNSRYPSSRGPFRISRRDRSGALSGTLFGDYLVAGDLREILKQERNRLADALENHR